MQSYEPEVRAVPEGGAGPTDVQVEVKDFLVEKFHTEAAIFDSTFWLYVPGLQGQSGIGGAGFDLTYSRSLIMISDTSPGRTRGLNGTHAFITVASIDLRKTSGSPAFTSQTSSPPGRRQISGARRCRAGEGDGGRRTGDASIEQQVLEGGHRCCVRM